MFHTRKVYNPFQGADRPEQPGPQRGIVLGVVTAVVSTIRRTIRSGIRVVEHPTRIRGTSTTYNLRRHTNTVFFKQCNKANDFKHLVALFLIIVIDVTGNNNIYFINLQGPCSYTVNLPRCEVARSAGAVVVFPLSSHQRRTQ